MKRRHRDRSEDVTIPTPALPPNGHRFWGMSADQQAAYLAEQDARFSALRAAS